MNTLQIHLRKTSGEDFSEANDDNITLVAIKATIADNYLIGDEASGEVAVNAEVARLYESHVTPYIHNTTDVDGK